MNCCSDYGHCTGEGDCCARAAQVTLPPYEPPAATQKSNPVEDSAQVGSGSIVTELLISLAVFFGFAGWIWAHYSDQIEEVFWALATRIY